MTVLLDAEDDLRVGDYRWVARAAERMLEALSLPTAELSIVICNDSFIHRLNRDFRKKDKPTDVLAFATEEAMIVPLQGHLQIPRLLGDVVISVETAKRQAIEHNWMLETEVVHLLAHGVLHLLGYDHATKREERRMSARTDALRSVVRPQKTTKKVDLPLQNDRVRIRKKL